MSSKGWPIPGDLIAPFPIYGSDTFGNVARAWQEPRIGSEVLDVRRGELCLVLVRALNPGADSMETGIDSRTRKKWERTWWMVMRPNGTFVWINEAQMDSMYEIVGKP